MLHITHKSWIKLVGTALLVIATFVGVSISSTVSASDLGIDYEVKKSITCLVFAKTLDLPKSTLNVYYKRIGEARYEPGAIYQIGYTTGMLDAYGYANSGKFGNYTLSRMDAAKNLYDMVGCTINESI